MEYDSYCFTSTGGRSYNEDSIGTRELPDGTLYILADGLGGHAHGELASKTVTETLTELSYEAGDDPAEWLQNALTEANHRVIAQQEENRCTMKSTAVALLIQDDHAYWAYVGDSRLYYLHDSRICDVTADHSVAYKKYKAGEISRDQIGQDEDQSSLLRALGNPDRGQADNGFAPDMLEPGDAFLLCSDGLWTYLKDEEVLIDLLKSETAQQWAELLLMRLMERIRLDSDNTSLITVLIR